MWKKINSELTMIEDFSTRKLYIAFNLTEQEVVLSASLGMKMILSAALYFSDDY